MGLVDAAVVGVHVELAEVEPEAATVGVVADVPLEDDEPEPEAAAVGVVAAVPPEDDEVEPAAAVGDVIVPLLEDVEPEPDAAVGVVIDVPLEDDELEPEAAVGVVDDVPLDDEPEPEAALGVVDEVPLEVDEPEPEAALGVVAEVPPEDDELEPAAVVGDVAAPLELLDGFADCGVTCTELDPPDDAPESGLADGEDEHATKVRAVLSPTRDMTSFRRKVGCLYDIVLLCKCAPRFPFPRRFSITIGTRAASSFWDAFDRTSRAAPPR